jgi:hypothetical protein
MLPKNFTMMSAQTGKDHDHQAHAGLMADIHALGLKHKVTEINGKYGYPEKSLMIEHKGRPQDISALDNLARKYKQESVLHSSWEQGSNGKGSHKNELRYTDGRPSVFGKGYRVNPEADDYYSDHPKFGRIQMHLDFDSKEATKAITSQGNLSIQTAAPGPEVRPAPPAIAKPEKTDNPPRKKFKKVPANAPETSPESNESPAKPVKDLNKTILHQDGETMIDTKSQGIAISALPKSMIAWGVTHMVPMKLNEVKDLSIGDARIKIVKKSPDLYAGWIEKEANIGHKFERLTLPQLLIHLQSALETYGREDQVFAVPSKTESDSIEEKIQPKLQKKNLTEIGKAISDAIDETPESSEADRQAKILEKLETLRAKIQSEIIPSKDLAQGIDEPEEFCSACEAEAEECSCYEGLSAPRLEFDGKKIKIFFKSDWSPEDKDNFKDDLKKRAGIILKKREGARKTRK